MESPQIGELVPSFSAPLILEGQDVAVTFESRAAQRLPWLLYFYPKDATPGCTQQACALRDSWLELDGRVQVIGISPDSEASHRKFIAKYGLPFGLLSDESHSVAQAFGVWVEKKLYGRAFMGVQRSSFLISSDGVILKVWPKVKPSIHVEEVLAALNHLGL